jgi:hypothetical protein
MNKYTVEVARLGQDILDLASSEFEDNFSIVARTQELLVLGNGLKNTSFCLKKRIITDRYFFEKTAKLTRK